MAALGDNPAYSTLKSTISDWASSVNSKTSQGTDLNSRIKTTFERVKNERSAMTETLNAFAKSIPSNDSDSVRLALTGLSQLKQKLGDVAKSIKLLTRESESEALELRDIANLMWKMDRIMSTFAETLDKSTPWYRSTKPITYTDPVSKIPSQMASQEVAKVHKKLQGVDNKEVEVSLQMVNDVKRTPAFRVNSVLEYTNTGVSKNTYKDAFKSLCQACADNPEIGHEKANNVASRIGYFINQGLTVEVLEKLTHDGPQTVVDPATKEEVPVIWKGGMLTWDVDVEGKDKVVITMKCVFSLSAPNTKMYEHKMVKRIIEIPIKTLASENWTTELAKGVPVTDVYSKRYDNLAHAEVRLDTF